MRTLFFITLFPLLHAHDTVGHIESAPPEIHIPYTPTITEIDSNNTFIASINDPKNSEKQQTTPPTPNQPGIYLVFHLPIHYQQRINDLLACGQLTIEIKHNIQEPSLFTLTPTVLHQNVNEQTKMIQYKAPIASSPAPLQPGEFFYIHLNINQ